MGIGTTGGLTLRIDTKGRETVTGLSSRFDEDTGKITSIKAGVVSCQNTYINKIEI